MNVPRRTRSTRRRARVVVLVAVAVAAFASCDASRPSSASQGTVDVVLAPTAVPASAPSSTDEESASTTDSRTTLAAPTGTSPPIGVTTTAATIGPTVAATVANPVAPTTTFGGLSSADPLVPPTAAEWTAFDAYLQDRLLTPGDFAVSVAVSIDGEPVHAAAFGDRDPRNMVIEPDTTVPPTVDGAAPTTAATTTTTTLPPIPLDPVDTTDRFRIASISKVITGTVVLELVEDGTLSLDAPVGAEIASRLGVDVTGRPAATITVRELLSHTAGFGTYERTFFRGGADSCVDAAALALSEGLDYEPGTTYHYSNMNFCVLGLLIEQVTGEPYEQVVTDRLLTPLGITGMRTAGTFDPRPDEVVHPSFPGRNYMETLGGAGAWMATPADLVRILDSLDNTKPGFHPLDDDLAALMRQPVTGITYRRPEERWYGLAMIAFADESWGHTGTVENTHAIVLHRPDGMTWAITVSGNVPDDTDDLAGIFQNALDAAGIDAPAPTTSTTSTTTTSTTTTIAPTVPPVVSVGG